MTIALDIAGTVAALATLVAAVGGILAARWARQAKTSSATTAAQTNGPLRAQGDAIAGQAIVLELIHDGIRSLGHQVGEIRVDMGRMDERLTAEVAALDAKISPPPAAGGAAAAGKSTGETPSK